MALQADRVAVGTTPTRLDAVDTVVQITVLVRNRSAVPVYVGGPGVTVAKGFQLDPGEGVPVDLRSSDGGVWAITETAGARVDRLQRGG